MDKIFNGDALTILRTFPSRIVQTCVTSPPIGGFETTVQTSPSRRVTTSTVRR
jgi:DNA modification methylase